MHRTTILLPPELRRKADKEAKALGISLSELIRRRLSGDGAGDHGTKSKPRFFSRKPWQGSGASDMAANHDEHLYGP
jgi:hypothetical protein